MTEGTNSLVVERDHVGDGSARVLNLDPSVGSEGVEDNRAVSVEVVRSVLPVDDGLDAVREGGWGTRRGKTTSAIRIERE